jgi:hypothetical protein
LETQRIHGYLAERLVNVPQADAIVLEDADGLVVNWSRDRPVPRAEPSHRDFYEYFKNHNDLDVFVGSPTKNRGTAELSLFIVRRINGPDGSFLGLALAVVDIKNLIDFYQAAGSRSEEAVTLLRRDGTMLIRYPDPESAIGVKLPQRTPWFTRVARDVLHKCARNVESLVGERQIE